MRYEDAGSVPVKQNHAEPNHLDMILDQYTLQAQRYFKAKNELDNAPPDLREKRQREFENIKRHLDAQRMHAEAIADAQAGLDAYREYARNAGAKNLLQEEHHPTDDLEKYMKAANKPKPDSNCTAHHIVPGKGKTKENYQTRVHLHINAIGINDPDNGVYLPKTKNDTPHWHMEKSLGHKQYHTHGYELWVRRKITVKHSEQSIRRELRMIGQMLQENNLPPEVRKKR